MTQQVSHRPMKCQSCLWSQRGTKVNGSHHGDNPLLRPTGIQIATKSFATLQAIAPTNIKQFVKPPCSISRAASIDSDCCRLPTISTSLLQDKSRRSTHIQRIGCQPEKTTLHGGQSRSWSAEQEKRENKIESLEAHRPLPPLPPPRCSFGEYRKKMTKW